MIEVYTSKYQISTDEEIFARTSQCVSLGIYDNNSILGGIAHIHYNTDENSLINSMFEELSKKDLTYNFSLYIAGGVNSYVSGFGGIFGEETADRTIDYIIKNNFESKIKKIDIYSDFVRIMTCSPKNKTIEIEQLKE